MNLTIRLMIEIENDKQIAWIFILAFHILVDVFYIMTFIDDVITESKFVNLL